MPLDFPSSPTLNEIVTAPNGTEWQWDGVKWISAIQAAASGGTSITVADTPPANPTMGSLWWDSVGTQMYIWYIDPNGPGQWVNTTNAGGAGASITISDTPPANPQKGAMWFDSVSTQLFIWYTDSDSSQWVTAINAPEGAIGTDAPTDGNTYVRQSGAWVASQPAGRNILHNGLFNIQQRGGGPWSGSGYTFDRWLCGIALGATGQYSLQPGTDADRTAIGDDGLLQTLQVQSNGVSGGQMVIEQRLENLFVQRLSGKRVILSFYARASVAGMQIGASVFFNGPAVTQAPTASIALTTTMQRYFAVIQMPSTHGLSYTFSAAFVQCLLWMNNPAGIPPTTQTGSINLWGIQLEIAQPGQVQPSPLEKLDPVIELQQCQRFYCTGNHNMQETNVAGGAYMKVPHPLPVRMRATPTVIWTVGGTSGFANTPAVMEFFPDALCPGFLTNAGMTGSAYWNGTFTASADL